MSKRSHTKYLAVQNGAEEVGFVDLLTGRQNHFHLVMVAQSARVVEVYIAQVLYAGGIVTEIERKIKKPGLTPVL